jgi:predicted DNA-binding protein YlxM (UPF0122 family)
MENRKPRDPENKLVEASLLMDTYGALLTERQRQFMRLHYEEDLSFSEIAREFKISRQAVHDSVKHATEALMQFEKVLGLVEKSKSGGEAPRISGRQLIERLDNLRRRVQRETAIFDPSWITRELTGLIALLRSGEGEPVAREEEAESAEMPGNGNPEEPQEEEAEKHV